MSARGVIEAVNDAAGGGAWSLVQLYRLWLDCGHHDPACGCERCRPIPLDGVKLFEARLRDRR